MWDSGLEFFFRGVCSDTAQCYALHVFSLCSSTPLSIIKTLRATGRTLRFCRLKDSRIAAVRLRPEMLISMSVSLKCNEHILGSISLLHFFVCSLTQNFPLLTISGLHGKITIIEVRSFLASIAANSHLFIAPTERKILQRTRSLPCSQKCERQSTAYLANHEQVSAEKPLWRGGRNSIVPTSHHTSKCKSRHQTSRPNRRHSAVTASLQTSQDGRWFQQQDCIHLHRHKICIISPPAGGSVGWASD